MTRARRGVGIPALVAVLIAFVAVVQVSQHLFTGQVTGQASRALAGRVAWQVALAAVQEARGLITARVAQPGTREYMLFRSGAPALGRSAPATIAVADLPDTGRLIREVHGGSVELVSIGARLEPKQLLLAGDRVPHEGVVSIEAHVRSRVEPVDRRVSRSWTYKVVHIAPSEELAKVVAMVRAPDRLLKSRYDAHQLARTAVEQDLPVLVKEIRDTLADVARQRAATTDAQERQVLDELRDLYAPLVDPGRPGSLVALLAPLEPRWRALAPLPANARDAVLVHRDTALSPAELDLQQDLDPLVTRHRQARDDAVRLGERARAILTLDAAATAAHQSYVDALRVLGDAIAKEAERYLRFREAFALVPASDPEHARILTAYRRIDPVERFPSFPVPAFDLTMCVLLDAPKLEPAPAEALARTLARLSGPRGFFGTIRVDNTDRPLELTGALRGRFVLVVTGPLSVENVTRSDPADLVTIVHAADATRPLSLAGRIDATIVASGTRLAIRKGTTITGGLFLEDVDPTTTIEPELADPERIAPDPVRADADPARLRHFVFSPWTRTLGSTRDR